MKLRKAGPSPLEVFGHAVGIALSERKFPDDIDLDSLTDRQMLEGTAALLDRLDDACDAYIDAHGEDKAHVGRSMQADLRRIASALEDES